MKYIVNALAYQAVWFLSILWSNQGAAIGCVIIIILLATSERRLDDLKMMGYLMFLALLIDGTLQQVGFFTFSNPGVPIPFWLLVLWVGLGMTIHHSFAWLKERLFLASLLGGIGGPAAYWAGVRMGAASFNWSLPVSLLVLSLVWSLMFPSVMLFSTLQRKSSHENKKLSAIKRNDIKTFTRYLSSDTKNSSDLSG